MKGSPIQQKLSTSFVDLTLLVRFLRDRSFTGTVRVEWDGYDGEIFFTRSPRIHAREYDRSIGRIAQGQNAFRRILERSRRPSGKIHILRNDPDATAEVLRKPFIDGRIVSEARVAAFGRFEQLASLTDLRAVPNLPRVHSATAALLATDLLLTFKEAFERTRLSFDTAFSIACAFNADEFPFLDPDGDEFSFFKDEIFISDRVDTLDLFCGIVAALRHIIGRLAGDDRFLTGIIYLRHRLQLHFSDRNEDYRRLGLNDIVDRLLY